MEKNKKNSGLRVGGVNVVLSPILMSNDDDDQFFWQKPCRGVVGSYS